MTGTSLIGKKCKHTTNLATITNTNFNPIRHSVAQPRRSLTTSGGDYREVSHFQCFGKRDDAIRLQLFKASTQQNQLYRRLKMYEEAASNTDGILTRHGGLLLVKAQGVVQRAFGI